MRDRQKWSFGLTAVVLIVCIVLFLNYSSRRIFRRDQEQPHSFDGEEYLTAVEERGEVQLLVDKSNVKSIVEQMEPPEQFYWSTATTLTSEDGAKESTCRYWQKGDRAKAELLDGETLVQTVLRTGDTVTVQNPASGASYSASYSLQYSPQALTGTADLRFFLDTDSRYIRTAQLLEYQGEQVLYVEYEFEDLDQVERHWLSLDYGIPLRSESQVGGQTVYTGETVLFDTSAPDDSVFQ